MSDISQGSGWWLASDGRWYPPDLHPASRLPPSSFGTLGNDGPPPAAPKASAESRRRTAVALSLLIGGAFCGIAGLALFFVTGFAGLLGSTVYDTPVHVVIHCKTGDYYVYQEVGSQISGPGFSFSHTRFPTLMPQDVVVTGPHEEAVATWSASGSETITKSSEIFSNAVGFHVPVSGPYAVTVSSTSPTAVIIGPSLGTQFVEAAPWLILSGVGLPIALVGLVLLIIESNRRRRTNRQSDRDEPR